jgi:hypothetical protein
MKIDDGISDWFRICVMAAVCCAALFGIGTCTDVSREERDQWAEQHPVEAAKNNCKSHVSGSRPACWSEGDWIEFCKRIECK